MTMYLGKYRGLPTSIKKKQVKAKKNKTKVWWDEIENHHEYDTNNLNNNEWNHDIQPSYYYDGETATAVSAPLHNRMENDNMIDDSIFMKSKHQSPSFCPESRRLDVTTMKDKKIIDENIKRTTKKVSKRDNESSSSAFSSTKEYNIESRNSPHFLRKQTTKCYNDKNRPTTGVKIHISTIKRMRYLHLEPGNKQMPQEDHSEPIVYYHASPNNKYTTNCDHHLEGLSQNNNRIRDNHIFNAVHASKGKVPLKLYAMEATGGYSINKK